ncbi:far upstream element-binding protein 2 isoform X2 [Syngnathus scovelli]|uniref:far upstream element-binding protein 2 isoform X2 n=1 Tax=Syngnathus scovelli TaxID=161590 RepID=UPI00210FB2C6|nr:far upstream element-binding protein 2 isoform X2 [Syngnathus scovelli]
MSGFGSLPTNGVGAGAKKDAFADAMERARQIAAKISGESGHMASNNGGAEGFPFAAQKRSLEEAAIGAQLAALAQQSVRPGMMTMTEECRVPDSMVGLVIGRGGEHINKIQRESGCKVQIAHDSAGLSERSVSLTGSPDAIKRAKALIDEIISRGHDSPNGQTGSMQEMVIPAGKAGLIIGKGGETIKQLQERAGVKMILIQDGSQPPNVDKPLRIIGDPFKVQQAKEMVNEILREREGFGDRNEYGSRIGGSGIDIGVPRHAVGVIIGRSGEMIKKIQSDAGVKIQFKPDDGTGPEKMAHITGPPDQCQHAASIITDLIQSIRTRDDGGQGGPPGGGMPPGGRGRGRGQGSWGPPGGEMTFSVPAHKCGLVIGRGGENVKAINQQTGAFVEMLRQPLPDGDPNFKLFTIRGSPQQIDYAKQLIEEKIEAPLCPVGGGPGPGGPGGSMNPYSPNPYNAGPPGGGPHGGAPGGPQYCAQNWGDSYQQWQNPGPQDPNKAAADPNAAWAAYYAQYYGQQPGGTMPAQNPADPGAAGDQNQAEQTAGGQPDYTKAWEEYYKKMGMVQPAGGSVAAPGTAAAPAGGAAAASGGQPDYSAAWAEYYRQQAAYYGQGGQAPGQGAPPQQGQQAQ